MERVTQHVTPVCITKEHQSTSTRSVGADLAADAPEGRLLDQFDRLVDDRNLTADEVGIAVRILADQTDAVANRVARGTTLPIRIEVDVQLLDVGFAQRLRAEQRPGTCVGGGDGMIFL